MEDGTSRVGHLVELIDAAYAVIGENKSTGLFKGLILTLIIGLSYACVET